MTAGWLRLRPSGHVHFVLIDGSGARTACGRFVRHAHERLTSVYPPLCKRCPICESFRG